MKDKERRAPAETCHILMAIRRAKENRVEDMTWRGELCFREVISDYEEDLATLKHRIQRFPGVWRIQKTVNARSFKTALTKVMVKVIEQPEEVLHKLDLYWRRCLLSKEAKDERNVLLDIDTADKAVIGKVRSLIEKQGPAKIIAETHTPNGYHIVASSLDTRPFADMKDVTLLNDGYIFIDRIEVKNEYNKSS